MRKLERSREVEHFDVESEPIAFRDLEDPLRRGRGESLEAALRVGDAGQQHAIAPLR